MEAGGSVSLSDPVIVQSILVETVRDSLVIAETIEAKQESGEIDELALTSDELAAIIELKQAVDVVSQVLSVMSNQRS